MLTLASAWYNFKSKFDYNIYRVWIKNILENVKKFNLVIFTDENSKQLFIDFVKNNPRIKVIIKALKDFYCAKYAENFIKNHMINISLNKLVDWRVNALWCEKQNFVKEIINNKYFGEEEDDVYGWMDLGYFRCNGNVLNYDLLKNWPNAKKVKERINRDKIYYCRVCNESELQEYYDHLSIKNENDLPKVPLHPLQVSIAGGFFILEKSKIDWWCKTFYDRLELYFKNGYLVKDDQMIIIDCIANNREKFELINQEHPAMDKWFGFQTYIY
jgi:hypothetical protein